MRAKGVRMRVTVDKNLTAWVDRLIERRVFDTRSHAVQWGLYVLKEKLVEKKKQRHSA